jgi:hypothetical protein
MGAQDASKVIRGQEGLPQLTKVWCVDAEAYTRLHAAFGDSHCTVHNGAGSLPYANRARFSQNFACTIYYMYIRYLDT